MSKQPALARCQLCTERLEFAGNGDHVFRRVAQRPHIDEVQQQPGTREVLEELYAETGAVAGALHWQGPVFEISALAGTGTDGLVQSAMRYVEQVAGEDAGTVENLS